MTPLFGERGKNRRARNAIEDAFLRSGFFLLRFCFGHKDLRTHTGGREELCLSAEELQSAGATQIRIGSIAPLRRKQNSKLPKISPAE
jgi:hypothetical protein